MALKWELVTGNNFSKTWRLKVFKGWIVKELWIKMLVFGIYYDIGRLLGYPIPEGFMSIRFAISRFKNYWLK